MREKARNGRFIEGLPDPQGWIIIKIIHGLGEVLGLWGWKLNIGIY